jgi:hypothetical protein
MTRVARYEILVEEPSMEAFLCALLPRLLSEDTGFQLHAFQGKPDLLGKLQQRLRAYARWIPQDWRIVVIVDRDDENCEELKRRLEDTAISARLQTRSQAAGGQWQLVNRIAIEELEAWYFGDWTAVQRVYPRVSADIPRQARFRDPDEIKGGTWEAFEQVLKRHGYFVNGLRKTEAARALGAVIEPQRSSSRSFVQLCDAFTEATA